MTLDEVIEKAESLLAAGDTRGAILLGKEHKDVLCPKDSPLRSQRATALLARMFDAMHKEPGLFEELWNGRKT